MQRMGGTFFSFTQIMSLFSVLLVIQQSFSYPSGFRFIMTGSSLKGAVVAGSAKPFDFPEEYGLTPDQVGYQPSTLTYMPVS